jgi:hypothetical protein
MRNQLAKLNSSLEQFDRCFRKAGSPSWQRESSRRLDDVAEKHLLLTIALL